MGYFNPIPDKNFAVDVVIKWIADILAVVVLALFAINLLCDKAVMVGNSMVGEINNSETVLINKFSYKAGDPKRFDVVVYKNDEGNILIKRIIGLPGEEIKISGSQIYIKNSDGEQKLQDNFFKGQYESGDVSEYVEIDSNEYFVMGDNRNVSEDSRFSYVGNVKKSQIIGKAWLIAAPFNRIGFIN